MRTFQSHSRPVPPRALSSSPRSLSRSAMSPLSSASITVAALLLLTSPSCTSAPVDLQQDTTHQPRSQIDTVCSSYLSADLQFWTSDVLRELCVLMLAQKSKELNVRENSKRFLFHYSRPQTSLMSPGMRHPLLHLVAQLQTRRERGISMEAELQGPGGVQSRGFFLYRPRNGRRYLEYE